MMRNGVPSWMVAPLPRFARVPEPEVVATRLRQTDLGVADVTSAEPEAPDVRWRLEVSLRGARAPAKMAMSVLLEKTRAFGPDFLLGRKHAKAAAKSQWAISVVADFGERPLADFQRQLRAVCAAAPDAVVLRDVGAVRTWTAAKAREMARHADPPCHHSLYQTHAVYDPCGRLWLHTHGLRRCGLVELEVLDARAGQAVALDDLLSVVSAHFLEAGVPEPGRHFTFGRGFDFVWLPPEKAIAHLPSRGLGSGPERDETHCVAAGVLLVRLRPARRIRYVSPAAFVPVSEGEEPSCAVCDHEELLPPHGAADA